MQTIIEKHFKHNYRTFVKRVQYRTANNIADAEDIVMEAYTRALKYKDTFELGMPFNHWFSRIVSNSYKDWKREQFNTSITDELDEHTLEPDTVVSKEEIEMIKCIEKEINLLTNEEHKEVLYLNLVYGFNIRDIVKLTNFKMKHITQIIQRFKISFKEYHA